MRLPKGSKPREPAKSFADLYPPKSKREIAMDNAKDAWGRAQLHGLGVGAAGILSALAYLGYEAATQGPLEFLLPDRPALISVVVMLAVTLGFFGGAAKNTASAATWAAIAGAHHVFGTGEEVPEKSA